MLPPRFVHTAVGPSPRKLPTPTLALAARTAALIVAASTTTLLPVWAQTAASTDKAQERSQRQSDNVYRWIKYFADQQPQKPDPSKARPKAADTTPPPVAAKKPETRPAAVPAQAATATETPVTPTAAATAEPPPTAPPVDSAPLQQPVPQVIAATAPAAPEPEAVVAAPPALRPINVVEPAIPREMRDETINASVRLSFTVLQDGSVSAPTVVSGSNRKLNRSALDAISQWRFEPIQTARLTNIEFEFRQE